MRMHLAARKGNVECCKYASLSLSLSLSLCVCACVCVCVCLALSLYLSLSHTHTSRLAVDTKSTLMLPDSVCDTCDRDDLT